MYYFNQKLNFLRQVILVYTQENGILDGNFAAVTKTVSSLGSSSLEYY